MCTYHRTGTYCSTACAPCDRRMLNASDRIQARQAARTSVLMRTKPNAR